MILCVHECVFAHTLKYCEVKSKSYLWGLLLDKGSMCTASSLRYTGAKIQRWEKEPRYKYLYRDKRENKHAYFLFGTGTAFQKEKERQDSRESIAEKKMRHTSDGLNLTGVSSTPLTNLHPSIQISCFLFTESIPVIFLIRFLTAPSSYFWICTCVQ